MNLPSTTRTDSVPAVIAISESSATTTSSANTSAEAINLVGSAKATTTKSRRVKSHFISTSKVNDVGKLLFVQPDNLKDLHMLRAIVLKTPWRAGFGNVGDAWNSVADMCQEQMGQNDVAVFEAGSLDGKAVRERFKVLLKWIRDETKSAMYRSGTDDEDPPTELVQLMEEMSELYLEWEESKEASGKKKADDRKRNREQAASIRDASLAGRSYDSLKSDDDTNSKKSKSTDNSFNLNGLMELATDQLKQTPQKQGIVERKHNSVRKN